jgi:PAS domain S-box-containing protein
MHMVVVPPSLTEPTDSPRSALRAARLRRGSALAGCVVAAMGLIVLIGWTFRIEILKRGYPTLITMKFNTAVSFVLLGAALVLLQGDRPRRALAAASAAAVVPTLTLVEYATGWSFGIDNPFGLDTTIPGPTTIPGRMAPATAACFALLALAVVAHVRRRPGPVMAATFLALLLSLLNLSGYAYGVESLYRFTYTSVAVHTAVGFVVASLGMLVARPTEGAIRLVTRDTGGADTVRRLLPAAVALPLATGSLVALLVTRGILDPPLAFAMLTLAMGLCLGALTWINGVRLDGADQRRAEAEEWAELLRRSEERTRRILETASDAFVTMGPGGEVRAWNAAAERMFGRNADEIAGRHVGELIVPELHGADRQATIDRLVADPHDVLPHQPRRALHRDGHEFPVEITVWALEADGGVEYNAFVHDISARKATEAELERQRRELARSNEELEQFAYVASHDLREPLRTIRAFGQLLAAEHGDDLGAEGQEFLGYIVDGTARMQRLIDDLLAYSSAGRTPHAEALPLNAVLDDVLAGLGPAIAEAGAAIAVEPLPTVQANRTQMELLLQNLVANAVKFRAPDRVPVVVVRAGDADAAAGATVYVDDNGIGIPEASRERVFKMFQRLHTREAYDGTGIGLAMCRKIARAAGGDVAISTSDLGGTRVAVTLPPAGVPTRTPA